MADVVATPHADDAARRHRPLLGWLVLVVFTVGRIAGLAHFAVEEHRRCALDGELIDVEAPTSPRESRPAATATLLAADPPGVADHMHCPFGGALHPQDTASVVEILDRTDTLALVAPHEPTIHSISTRAIYRLAPKTSPPAALLSIA